MKSKNFDSLNETLNTSSEIEVYEEASTLSTNIEIKNSSSSEDIKKTINILEQISIH